MKNTYVYKLAGLKYISCAKAIQIQLEKAGFVFALVDRDAKELIIPESYLDIISEIKKVIDNMGYYRLQI